MPFTFQAVPAVLPLLVVELELNYAEAGSLVGLFMLPGVVLAIPAGWLGQRLGDKRVTILGFLALGLGCLVVAGAANLATAGAGRLLSGVGGILLTVMLAKMTTDWFAGREVATAFGCLLSSWPVGLGIAVATFGWLAASAGWASVLHLAALYCAFAAVLVLLCYRDPPVAAAGAPTPTAATRRRFRLSRGSLELAALAGLAWGAFNAGLVLFLAFAPLSLVALGWEPASAGVAASLLMWLCVPLLVLGGHLADRTGKGDRIIVMAALGTGIAMAAMPFVPAPVVAIVLAGVISGASAGAIMSLPQGLPAAERAPGFGVYYTVNYVCMSALPPLAGVVVDLFGDPAAAVVLTGVVMASPALFLWLFRARQAALVVHPAA